MGTLALVTGALVSAMATLLVIGGVIWAGWVAAVAHFIDISVRRGNTDAKPLWVGQREFRNVVGHLAVFQATETGVQGLKVILNGGSRHDGIKK
jgi:hypothetical protein